MTVAVLAAIAAIVALAAFGQTVAGFGFSLLAVPPLSLVVDPKAAVAIALLLLIANSGLLAWGERTHIRWRAVASLLLGAVPGLPIGLVLLDLASVPLLRVALAMAIVGSVAVLLSPVEPPDRGMRVELGAGFLTGVLTTSLTTNGPPTVLALQARELEPEAFRPTTSAVLGLTSAVGAVLFAGAGRITDEVLAAVLAATPAMLVGWLVGTRARQRLPAERFRQAVFGLLLAAAVATFVGAFA